MYPTTDQTADPNDGTAAAEPLAGWRVRPGWGTIRDYKVTGSARGVEAQCRFIPDDGSPTVQISLYGPPIPELGEFARGVLPDHDELIIKVPAAVMVDVAHDVFARINEMSLAVRQYLHAESTDLPQDCGWAWTPDFRLVKAARGLLD